MWFRDDVARILASTQQAMHNSLASIAPLDPEMAAAYQQGFDNALEALALAFGLRLHTAAVHADRQGFPAMPRANIEASKPSKDGRVGR